MMKHPIAVIGAAGVEIGSRTEKSLSSHEPNPGEIAFSIGGSGYRIARDLASLGLSPSLFTLFGRDAVSALLREASSLAGIDVSSSAEGDLPPAASLQVMSERGDRSFSVSDTRLFAGLDRSFFEERLPLLNLADACVFSADLEKDVCLFLAENLRVPLFALGVSPAKCTRLSPILGRLFGVSLSLIEARRLTGRLSPADCASFLCQSGIKLVLLSLGAEGFLLASGSDRVPVPFIPRPGREEAALDGAGAALLWGFSERLPLRSIAWAVSRAAAAASAKDGAPLTPHDLIGDPAEA